MYYRVLPLGLFMGLARSKHPKLSFHPGSQPNNTRTENPQCSCARADTLDVPSESHRSCTAGSIAHSEVALCLQSLASWERASEPYNHRLSPWLTSPSLGCCVLRECHIQYQPSTQLFRKTPFLSLRQSNLDRLRPRLGSPARILGNAPASHRHCLVGAYMGRPVPAVKRPSSRARLHPQQPHPLCHRARLPSLLALCAETSTFCAAAPPT